MLKPTYNLKSVCDIDRPFLNTHNVRGIILDVDNTLTEHGSQEVPPVVTDWLASMKHLGIKLIILSNNTATRAAPFAENNGLLFVASAKKPLPFGVNRAVKSLGLPKKQVLLSGDQIFTDMLGGNFAGLRTALVTPFHLENTPSFRFKRRIERRLFGRDFSSLETKDIKPYD
ncbi:MAG: YqeG family HAD IIIA-type phosphatase [Oscillospiraceae bacterium]|jgi:HAD superfamily phosphatase (TIGR01668 family)|nr:YqeG family HAD IIIA-type phosphatase [Oscillospiraceae bacterium]